MSDQFKIPPKPTPSVILPSSLLENTTQEPLKVIVAPYQGVSHLPSDIQAHKPALLVFLDLLACFESQKCVAEGLLPNLIWGFAQAGRDSRIVAEGLSALRQLGYLRYSDPFGNTIQEHGFDERIPVWVRYQPKLTNLLVRK